MRPTAGTHPALAVPTAAASKACAAGRAGPQAARQQPQPGERLLERRDYSRGSSCQVKDYLGGRQARRVENEPQVAL